MIPNVIVVIRGGALQAVYSDRDINVDLLDYDNMEVCGSENEDEVYEYEQYKALENVIKTDKDFNRVW